MGKQSLFIIISVLFAFRVAPTLAAQDPPAGFKDPKVFADVMAGNINNQSITNTDMEEHLFLRSYFNKVSPQAYAALATSYEKYPDMFEEILEASTTSVNDAKTVFQYKMDIVFSYLLVPFHVYPEGRHTVTYGADATKETTIFHTLLNYQDQFAKAEEHTRLIPFQNGILVEDEILCVLKQATSTSTTIKQKLVEEFTKFQEVFRTTLKGDK